VIYGRLKIYSDAKEITAENVVDEVNKAYAVHSRNQSEIRTLWEYYRGKTKILNKTKEIREEINHKINENRAYEIVKFHKSSIQGVSYMSKTSSGVYHLPNGMWGFRYAFMLDGKQKDIKRTKDENGNPFKSEKADIKANALPKYFLYDKAGAFQPLLK
jgi:hypothetical protein